MPEPTAPLDRRTPPVTVPVTGAPRPTGPPWTIPDAAAFMRVSPRHFATLIAKRQVRVIRLGRRVLVPDDEMARLAREGTR